MTRPEIRPSARVAARWLIGLGVPAVLAAGIWFLYRFGSPLPCLFHEATGLYCPGCGSGRAAFALLRLDILVALNYNPLFVMALPVIVYCLCAVYMPFVFHVRLPMPDIRPPAIVGIIAVILLFWILRNISVFPFAVLAP